MMDRNSFLKASNERLLNIVTSKIRTTFIGNLSILEQEIKNIIPENVWENIRKKILDSGNNNIRAIEKEFRQYEIDWTGEKHILRVVGGKNEE